MPSDITRTVIPRETVAAKEEIQPGDVGWAQVWVQMAPEPGFSGHGKLGDPTRHRHHRRRVRLDRRCPPMRRRRRRPSGGPETLRVRSTTRAQQWRIAVVGAQLRRARRACRHPDRRVARSSTRTTSRRRSSQRQVVTATDDLLPNEIGWTPRIELAPLTPGAGLVHGRRATRPGDHQHRLPHRRRHGSSSRRVRSDDDLPIDDVVVERLHAHARPEPRRCTGRRSGRARTGRSRTAPGSSPADPSSVRSPSPTKGS